MTEVTDDEKTHSICVQRKEKKGSYRIQSFWDESEINITLLDGSFAFNSTITKDELTKQSHDYNMKYDDYILKVYSALRNEKSDIFLYERQQETFFIYRHIEHRTIDIKLVIFNLKQIDYSEAAETYIDKLNQVANRYKEKLEKSSHDHMRAIEEKNQVDKKLGEFVKLKQEVENELYSRFLLLLNEKKKRISHLMQVVDALKNGAEPDEDYELVYEEEEVKGKGKGKSNNQKNNKKIVNKNKETKKQPSSWDLNSDEENAKKENDKTKDVAKTEDKNNLDSDTDEDLMRIKSKKVTEKKLDENKLNLTKTNMTSRSSWDSDTDEDLIREYNKERINKNSKKTFEKKSVENKIKSNWNLGSENQEKSINPFALRSNKVTEVSKPIEAISGSDSESEIYARVTQKWDSPKLESRADKRRFEAISDSEDSKPDPISDYKTTESESNTDAEDTFGKVTHKVQIEIQPAAKRKFDDLDDFSPPKISLPKRMSKNDVTAKTIEDINKISLASPKNDADSQDLFDDNGDYTFSEDVSGKGDKKEVKESESLDFCTQDLLDRL